MTSYFSVILCVLIFSILPSAWSKQITLESGEARMNVIELYSSEGCSSCPPADKWLAKLKNHKELWKSFVPLEFHVDYWNYLGWNDPHSQKAYSKRQSTYSNLWGSTKVYTPNFILNGKDWRPGKTSFTKKTQKVGNLKAQQVSKSKFSIEFKPSFLKAKTTYKIYTALLGNGLSTDVKYGENKGRKLRHEFVVLGLKTEVLKKVKGAHRLSVELPKNTKIKPKSYAVAFWIGQGEDPTPVQAVGGALL